MKKIKDTFNYEIKDVAYEDSYTSGDGLLRCVFMLNGKNILEIVREASGRNVNCTPCQGHFYLFVLGNVCLSTLQLTIPSNG